MVRYFPWWLAGWVLLGVLATGQLVHAQDELLELVTGLLADEDPELRGLALNQIRTEAPGAEMTRRFAELLPKLPPETQVGLLSALGDRGDSAAAPAVRDLLNATSDEPVRVAALHALGKLGSREDLPLLLESMSQGAPLLREAARAGLVRLPSDATGDMVAAFQESPGPTRLALLEVLAARRAREALPMMLAAARGEDQALRRAAMDALSELAEPSDIPDLVELVLATPEGRERDQVERAVAAVCRRNDRDGDPRQPAAPVLSAIRDRSEAEQTILLSMLGRIGGPDALQVVEAAVTSVPPQRHRAGVQALCNWPDGSVVGNLLRVARTDDDPELRHRAFRALIRIAPLDDHRDDRRRLDTLRTVLAMCDSDSERNLVVERAQAIRSVETLRFLLAFLDNPALAQQACLSIVELAHHSSLRESHREEFHRALDEVIRVSRDATVVDRAQRYKNGQTWVRPKPGRASSTE